MKLEQKLGSQTPPFEVTVWVKNIGTAAAAASTTAVMWSTNVQASTNAVRVVGALATPTIAVGGTTSVKVTVTGALSSRKFMFLVDAPVAGKPWGQVGEGVGQSAYGPAPLGELNNAFSVPYSPGSGYVQVFLNPAVP